MASEKRLIDVRDCPCDGCQAKPCGHPARCVKFALWLNKTVDAVEVVRCKDCKYRVLDKVNGEDWCKHTLGLCSEVYATDYCCHGERKDNESKAD